MSISAYSGTKPTLQIPTQLKKKYICQKRRMVPASNSTINSLKPGRHSNSNVDRNQRSILTRKRRGTSECRPISCGIHVRSDTFERLRYFPESVGLSFIFPIIEVAEVEGTLSADGPTMELFFTTYKTLTFPFILGVSLVLVFQFTRSFVVRWLGAVPAFRHEQHLRMKAFEDGLDAKVVYYDDKETDAILNAKISETRTSERRSTRESD